VIRKREITPKHEPLPLRITIHESRITGFPMTKQVQEAYIVAATRTPVGKAPKGVFRNTRPDDMLAHVLKSVVAQAPGIDLSRIDDAVIGCAMPEAEQGMNVARIGVLLAGLPDTVAAQTINRFCSSGLQAVALAADQIRLGNADLMLAGGTESMSMVPMMGNKVALSPSVFNDDHVAIAYGMGITAEKVAEEWKVSREQQDAFALASHQKAIAAINAGEFRDEISPYEIMSHVPDLAGNTIQLRKLLVDTDEGPRPDSSIEGLAKLRPVFRNGQFGGTVTAGNSSQMSDGAAAVLLASEQAVKDYGLTPLARFVSFSVAGVRPEVMGIGPIAAIPKALKQAGLTKDQLDWIELNEAFAAQALAVIKDSELDPSKVNPLGGAIALGHPLGATGAVRTATIVHGLRRRQQKYGMVTMCIGTGMGAAGIFEAL
jgi:acetyl-CoA acyltransferase